LREVHGRNASAGVDVVRDIPSVHGKHGVVARTQNTHRKQRVELSRASGGDGHARFEGRQLHEASSVQRQLFNGAALDDTFDGVVFIVDLRGGAFDDDQVLGAAQLHLQVDGSGASDNDGGFAL